MVASPRSYVSLEYRARERGYSDVRSMVSDALAQGGNVLAASEIIGCANTALVKWLDRNGYTVEKTAVLRPTEEYQRAS